MGGYPGWSESLLGARYFIDFNALKLTCVHFVSEIFIKEIDDESIKGYNMGR